MEFRIKLAREKDGIELVTGYIQATNDYERELVETIVEIFDGLPSAAGKLACNGKTVLFKSVEVNLMKQLFKCMEKHLQIVFTCVVSPHFIGDLGVVNKNFGV